MQVSYFPLLFITFGSQTTWGRAIRTVSTNGTKLLNVIWAFKLATWFHLTSLVLISLDSKIYPAIKPNNSNSFIVKKYLVGLGPEVGEDGTNFLIKYT